MLQLYNATTLRLYNCKLTMTDYQVLSPSPSLVRYLNHQLLVVLLSTSSVTRFRSFSLSLSHTHTLWHSICLAQYLSVYIYISLTEACSDSTAGTRITSCWCSCCQRRRRWSRLSRSLSTLKRTVPTVLNFRTTTSQTCEAVPRRARI